MESLPNNVFSLSVWRVRDDKTIKEACIVQVIWQPDTESFHLLLDEENIEELIELWLEAGENEENKNSN